MNFVSNPPKGVTPEQVISFVRSYLNQTTHKHGPYSKSSPARLRKGSG
jgi:hypothetical protein